MKRIKLVTLLITFAHLSFIYCLVVIIIIIIIYFSMSFSWFFFRIYSTTLLLFQALSIELPIRLGKQRFLSILLFQILDTRVAVEYKFFKIKNKKVYLARIEIK
jgi:hypothetical protein